MGRKIVFKIGAYRTVNHEHFPCIEMVFRKQDNNKGLLFQGSGVGGIRVGVMMKMEIALTF